MDRPLNKLDEDHSVDMMNGVTVYLVSCVKYNCKEHDQT